MKCNAQEREVILLMISFLIIHELGHLLTRWMDNINFPETFGACGTKAEADYFIEKFLLNSVIGLVF